MDRSSTKAAHPDAHGVIDAFDSVLTAARRGWHKARASLHSDPGAGAAGNERLVEAFRVFTDAAARLEGAYSVLRGRVEQLTAQLALANGALDRQLREKQALVERQSALLAALPAGILLLDRTGVVREANAAAERLLGARILDTAWVDLAARLLPTECDSEWTTAGDEPRRLGVAQQRLDSGGAIVVLHDVSEAHAARVRFERSQRLAAMGEMASRVAHQLRTPLATAMLCAGQLERPGITLEERTRLGEKIMSRLRSLERVTREMLRFVRGEPAPLQTVEVSALLAEAVDVMRPVMAARGVVFTCQDNTGGGRLHGDRRGVLSALVSLLENAAQATASGGKVRVDAMANSLQIRIRVADSGTGIPAHAVGKVFEPFYSTRAEGTGLGLAIVKSVAESHGGSVEVATSYRSGTVFTLALPRERASAAAAGSRSRRQHAGPPRTDAEQEAA